MLDMGEYQVPNLHPAAAAAAAAVAAAATAAPHSKLELLAHKLRSPHQHVLQSLMLAPPPGEQPAASAVDSGALSGGKGAGGVQLVQQSPPQQQQQRQRQRSLERLSPLSSDWGSSNCSLGDDLLQPHPYSSSLTPHPSEVQGAKLRVYSLLPRPLAPRARGWGNALSFKPGALCVDPPYFNAPGTLYTDPGSDDYALPRVTFVFVEAEEAKQLARRCHADMPAVTQLALSCFKGLLCGWPGGYLCRSDEGQLRFMLAFAAPADALEWCMVAQVGCWLCVVQARVQARGWRVCWAGGVCWEDAQCCLLCASLDTWCVLLPHLPALL